MCLSIHLGHIRRFRYCSFEQNINIKYLTFMLRSYRFARPKTDALVQEDPVCRDELAGTGLIFTIVAMIF